MAKPRTPNQKKRYAALNKRLAKYVSLVQDIYDSLALDAAIIVTSLTDYSPDTDRPFRFKDYPLTKSRVNKLMRFFSKDIQALIYAGTTEEWKQSNLVQDLLVKDVMKVYGMQRNGEKLKQYYQPNNDALKAFQQRKDKGRTVSQKVWNQSYNFKQELEYAISSAIEKGQSAVTLSKRISKYLHDYPSLCDDYKEKYGTAVDCKNCEYRSIRLAASEINMAYRTAEQTRWSQMDFIKGYQIKLSGSHPRYDVCDELAGIYPKWFKWSGWHPLCRCICIPIVMTDDEWYSGKGQEITELPQNYKEWIFNNTERIEKAKKKGTLPYWIKDNYDENQSLFNRNEGDSILRKADFSIEERIFVDKQIRNISDRYPFFQKDVDITFGETKDNAYMEWTKDGLVISDSVFGVPGGEFAPCKHLVSAFEKMNKHQSLNFSEEYAIECLYHEYTHSIAPGVWRKKKLGERKVYETCTQLYARANYGNLLKAYGVEPTNFEGIRDNGFGYNSNCKIIFGLIKDYDVFTEKEFAEIVKGNSNGAQIIKNNLIKKGVSKHEANNYILSLSF